jgi:hypothetical protein
VLKEVTMNEARGGRDRLRPEQTGATNRRSLLTLVIVGIGALLPQRARAHQGDPASDAEPAATLPRYNDIAGAASLADLKKVGAECQVRAIRHMRSSYWVVTADGNDFDFPESDLRFKVDSSAMGPFRGSPVIMPAGQVGDRVWVFFAAPDEISTFIKHQS